MLYVFLLYLYQMQRKMNKRKSRRSSVGTCTQEDGIITDYTTDPDLANELEAMEAQCPMHGSQPTIELESPAQHTSYLKPTDSPKERRVSFEDQKSPNMLDVCVGPQQVRRKSAPSSTTPSCIVDTGPLPYQRSNVSPASSVSTHTGHGSSSSSRQRTSPGRSQSPAQLYTGSHGSSSSQHERQGRHHHHHHRSPSRASPGSPSHGRSPSRSPRSSLVPSPLGPPGPVALSEHRRRSKEAREIARRESASDLSSNIPVAGGTGSPVRMIPPEALQHMMTLQPPGIPQPRPNLPGVTRVRRSSSDGDTYLNLAPSFRFVQSNMLESHSSDSAVILNRDIDHMLNPHLSAFQKDSFADSGMLPMSNYSSLGNVYAEDIPRPRGRQWSPQLPVPTIKSESSEHSSSATGSAGKTDSSRGDGRTQDEGKGESVRYSSPSLQFHTPPTTDETASSSSSKDSFHR